MTNLQLEKLIRKYANEGIKRRAIARRLEVSRYQVDKVLGATGHQNPEKIDAMGLLKPMHEQINEWVYIYNLPAKIIHDRIVQKKINVSYPTLCRYLKSLNKQEVYVPVHTSPGEESQVDFGYLGIFNKGAKKVKVWVFNMVLSYSRYAFYKIVTDQSTTTFLNCHADAFEFFRGVPASIKIDNLGAGVLEADFFEATFQQKYLDFLDHYDTTAITARPNRPEDKGKTEAGIKLVKGLFLKGLEHTNFDQLVADLEKWNKTDCNMRVHGTTKKVPTDEFHLHEKAKLIALPEERFRPIEYETRKVNHYGHVYFKKNYYSVPSQFSGDTVQVESNGAVLKIYKDDALITIHAVKQGEGEFATEDHHKPYHKQIKSELFYLEQAQQIGDKAVRLLNLMQAERPYHWKTMIKGVFGLNKVYSSSLIERACAKTIIAGPHSYKKVRSYCEELIQEPQEEKVIKNVNGYYRDLSIYDQLANRMQGNK